MLNSIFSEKYDERNGARDKMKLRVKIYNVSRWNDDIFLIVGQIVVWRIINQAVNHLFEKHVITFTSTINSELGI